MTNQAAAQDSIEINTFPAMDFMVCGECSPREEFFPEPDAIPPF